MSTLAAAAPRPNYRPHVIVLGLAVGFGLAAGYLPGGFDALTFYLKAPQVDTTAPAWVYLLTYPLSWLPWPLSYQVLVFGTVLVAGLAGLAWGNRRWWIALITPPLLWTVWLGQIEIFPLAGLLLTALILNKKLHPAWLGVAWLALLAKPQVGLGILVLQLWWGWREARLGVRGFAAGLVVMAALLVATLVFWPSWVPNWLTKMSTFTPTTWNAAIWPYGLAAWPVALLAYPRASQLQRLRLFTAAGLLGTPYFALYHCLTLLAVADGLLAVPLAWGILLIGWGVPAVWQGWGWLLPVGLIVIDIAGLALAHWRPAPATAVA